MLQLLKVPNTGHNVHSTTVHRWDCLLWDTPGTKDLYNMLVHATHELGVRLIAHLPLPSLASNRRQ